MAYVIELAVLSKRGSTKFDGLDDILDGYDLHVATAIA